MVPVNTWTMMVLTIVLTLSFGMFDRMIGKGLPGHRSFSNGLAALIATGLYAAFGPQVLPSVILILVWIVYRSLPWSIGGTLTPETVPQAIGSLLRHGMPAAGAFGCWVFMKNVQPHIIIPTIVYALGAWFLTLDYTVKVRVARSKGLPEEYQWNADTEITRGMIFGLCLAGVTMGLLAS